MSRKILAAFTTASAAATVGLTAGLSLLPLTASAFNIDGTRWSAGEALFHIGIPGKSPSGISWSEAFEDAMAEWNDNTDFRFYLSPEYRDPCSGYRRNEVEGSFPAGGGDAFNGVDFADTMCGNELGKGVAAVTLIVSNGGMLGFSNIAQTDIIFNSSFAWDVFSGLRSQVDFRRTALHELGHALGLGHEVDAAAIMAPNLSAIDSLQADDIQGANRIYGGPVDCEIRDIAADEVISDSLDGGDCAMFELYNGGNDTSFVDAYRLTLDKPTAVSILMESSALDPVLVITDPKLAALHLEDDTAAGNCNARFSGELAAGEYLILANTYVRPEKCAGNTGPYRLTVTEKSVATTALSVAGLAVSALFTGGASSDGGLTYADSFSASDPVTVSAEILLPREHVGQSASLYVMAVLADGRRFAKNAAGQFERVRGGIDTLPAFRKGVLLGERETVNVLNGFRAESVGISGRVSIFIGYALGDTREIIHNREPIRFTVE